MEIENIIQRDIDFYDIIEDIVLAGNSLENRVNNDKQFDKIKHGTKYIGKIIYVRT
ncbi:MAG: hypothetical protein KAR64_02330 [Thermoplasmatales archaeon]|nr:hypothetical protein [Thermoplasmatales archaeon]